MLVIHKPTGQLGEIPDDKFDPNLFEQAQQNVAQKSSGNTQPQTQGVSNPWGKSVDELRQAQAKALAKGDKKNAALFGNLIDIESSKETDNEPGTETQRFNQSQASKALAALEEAYGRGDSKNIGTDNDLSLKPNATTTGELRGSLSKLFKKITDSDYSEDVNIYNAQRAQFVSALTQITGAGAPQEAEAKRLIDTMPKPNSTNKEAREWFNNARKLLGSAELETNEYTSSKTKNSSLGESALNTAEGVVSGVGNFLLGSTKNLINDVVQTLPAKERNKANQILLKRADELSALAQKETDPEKKKQMFAQAKEINQMVSDEAANIAGGFSDDIEKSTLRRSVETGIELGSTADIALKAPGLASKLPGMSKKAVSKVKNFQPVVNAAEKRMDLAVKSDVGFRGGEFAKVASDYVRNVDPSVKNFVEKTFIPNLRGKRLDVVDVLKRLEVWNKAYSTKGTKLSSAKAGLYDTLSKYGREQLSEKAPEVFEAHLELQKALSRTGFAQSIGRQTVRTAAATAVYAPAGYALSKLLRIGK